MLLVEDDPDDAAYARRMLGVEPTSGFSIDTAGTLAAAISLNLPDSRGLNTVTSFGRNDRGGLRG